ncbi:unnamed protein product [Chrysoparadoxa australica]
MKTSFSLLALLGLQAEAFVHLGYSRSAVPLGLQKRTICSMAATSGVVRREVLGAAITAAAAAVTLAPVPSLAAVTFELDKYGDKELKLATVNKLRQSLRNQLVKDPSLAPKFIALAVSDALGHDFRTDKGGPDGSVLFELERPENAGLSPALDAIKAVKKGLQRTNELSLADVIAVGGGEAIEACGGPRLVVQLGRTDAKAANAASNIAGLSYAELKPVQGDSSPLCAAFTRSGLGPKEAALIYAAVGTCNLIAEEAVENAEDEEDDDLVDNSWQNTVVSSFGQPSEIYGKGINYGNTKFDTKFIDDALKKERKTPGQLTQFEQALLGDKEMKNYLMRYSGNVKGYLQDLADSYSALTALGAEVDSITRTINAQ